MLKVKRVILGEYDVNPGAEACYKKIGFLTETYQEEVLIYIEKRP